MTFKNNIKLLNSYKTRSNKNNDMIDSIISLYEEKKIPNMKTAENAVVMLSSKHKATIPKALENYKKIVAKYTDAEPMTGRLSRPDFSTNSTTGLNKAKTHIQFNIRTSNHSRFDKSEEGAEKLTLDDVYRQVKLKLVKEVAAVMAHKKSMKIKAGVKFEIGKIKIDAFQDEHTEKDKD